MKNYVDNLKKEGKPVRLVLGVRNNEQGLDQRFDETYIFLDNEHDAKKSISRSLLVNFNILSHLKILNKELKEEFNEIILDDSTFDTLNWNIYFLRELHNLLAPNGKFIFAPDLKVFAIDRAYSSKTLKALSEEIKNSYKNFNDKNKPAFYRLINNINKSIPLNLISDFYNYNFLGDF